MVNYTLMITGDLENIATLQPRGGCDDPTFSYFFKLKCGSCGEVSQKETCVVLEEKVQLPSSKGTANLVQKCKFCGREGNVSMIPGKGKPLTQESSEAGKYVPLMMFDCRGYEPEGFLFGSGWIAQSVSSCSLLYILPFFLLFLLLNCRYWFWVLWHWRIVVLTDFCSTRFDFSDGRCIAQLQSFFSYGLLG
ncbi:CXXC motif containing zinc binding protein [Linum perenne]